eukprot:TRINITY_DN963_c0_g1_i4.p1 TRINITY_DN963_c0_g1~~TRINITY_DN963_c0_g1_i4.p1  ORF type:complete len:336 (+),score=78.10 TRINITY_DN963_c0_g1_i4:78-1085(+)
MGCCSSSPEPQGKYTPSANKTVFRDRFETLEELQAALQKAGLESSNLIIGVDFTKSNTWTGKQTFGGKNLHYVGSTEEMNPYEKAIYILGRTLSVFDDDQLIPAYGFGDATTGDRSVFAFNQGDRPCQGFQEVLGRYRQLATAVNLAGPTSFGPIIRRAVDIVDRTRSYHILLIVADGQVTRSEDLRANELSPQERDTINAIVEASNFPLSIVMVGVGDGPWDQMEEFDDRIPTRKFDNFQFVNFHRTMAQLGQASPSAIEANFATNALMEIPDQFSFIKSSNMLSAGRPTGHVRQTPQEPIVPNMAPGFPQQGYPPQANQQGFYAVQPSAPAFM